MQRLTRFLRPIANLAASSSRSRSVFHAALFRRNFAAQAPSLAEVEKEAARIESLVKGIRSPLKLTGVAGEAAQDLFIVAKAKNMVAQVASDMAFLSRAAIDVPPLQDLFISPDIPVPTKREVINGLSAIEISDLTIRFLNDLLEENQLQYTIKIADNFQRLAKADRNETNVTITLAAPAPPTTIKRIEDVIRRCYLPNAKLSVSVVLNPSILGGLNVTIEDEVIDLTKRTDLSILEARLSEALSQSKTDPEVVAAQPKWVETGAKQ